MAEEIDEAQITFSLRGQSAADVERLRLEDELRRIEAVLMHWGDKRAELLARLRRVGS